MTSAEPTVLELEKLKAGRAGTKVIPEEIMTLTPQETPTHTL